MLGKLQLAVTGPQVKLLHVQASEHFTRYSPATWTSWAYLAGSTRGTMQVRAKAVMTQLLMLVPPFPGGLQQSAGTHTSAAPPRPELVHCNPACEEQTPAASAQSPRNAQTDLHQQHLREIALIQATATNSEQRPAAMPADGFDQVADALRLDLQHLRQELSKPSAGPPELLHSGTCSDTVIMEEASTASRLSESTEEPQQGVAADPGAALAGFLSGETTLCLQ